MTQVLFKFRQPDGTPLAGAGFTIQLRRSGFVPGGGGVIVPDTLSFVTGEDGSVIAELEPSTSVYLLVLAEGPDTCSGVRYKFYVPKSDVIVNAEELYLDPPPSSEPWDETAIQMLTDAKLAAMNAAIEAKASADAADISATEAAASAEAAASVVEGVDMDADRAERARDASEAYSIESLAARIETDEDRIAAQQAAIDAGNAAEAKVSALSASLASNSDASKGTGQLGNSVITVATVAAMVALTGLRLNQRIQTLGYFSPGDGGDNAYLVVASATGPADGGLYINLTGFQAKGMFPGRKLLTKQFGANGNNAQADQDAPIRTALSTILTDSQSSAWGADVEVSLGAFKVGSTIAVPGDRRLSGTGGPNATKLIADTNMASGTAVLTTPGAFAAIENLSVHVPTEVYDPSTNTGTPVDGIKADNAASFGNTYNNIRINGGRIGFHAAAGLENKLNHSFIVGSRVGVQADAWDTECNFTIIQDCKQYALNAVGHGIESVSSHFVRGPILINVSSNGSPVHLIKPFLDTPADIGVNFTDSRGGQIVSAYGLKIGNNANNNAVLFKMNTNSSFNFFNGGSNINTGESFAGVFQFDSSSSNNKICGWHINSKTVAFSNHSTMWRQTCWANTGDAARYNNIQRKNRGFVASVAPDATAQLTIQLDYTFPALTYNTVLFFGKWVSRSASVLQGAVGDVILPIQFNDTGCAASMPKITGGAAISWAIDGATLVGNVVTVTVRNTGTAAASLSLDIERSMDATGATF